MSDQKDQERNLNIWFGIEKNNESDLSESSDRASVISSASLSSLSQKYQAQLNSDLSVNTSIWGTNESPDSGDISKKSEHSASSSSTSTQKYRKVTSSSSCSSSPKTTNDYDDDLSAPLLHVHKVMRRKKSNSSSIGKQSKSVDITLSSANTNENDSSSSTSQLLGEHLRKDFGQIVPTPLQGNNSLCSPSDIGEQSGRSKRQTSLEDAQNRGEKRAEKERNDGASSFTSQHQSISALSSPTVVHIKNNLSTNIIGGNLSSADTRQEAYRSLTSILPVGAIDQKHGTMRQSVDNMLGTHSSSVNSQQTNAIGQVSDNLTYPNGTAGDSVRTQTSTLSSTRFGHNQTLNGLPVENARAPSLHGSSSSSPIAGETASDSLSSAIDSVLYRDYSHITPEAAHAEMVRENSSRTLCRKDPPFPQKLHQILSRPDYKQWIAWLPHGRAWKILDQARLEENVLPKYFQHCKLNSFMRQVSNWGFKRVQSGRDQNSYYHEFFLRGLPHVSMKMKRQRPGKSKEKSILTMFHVAPDFYQASKEHPLPDENGAFPPTMRPQPPSILSNGNIALQPLNNNSHQIATISANPNSSINVATPLENPQSAASFVSFPTQSSQEIIAQECTSSVTHDGNSIFLGNFSNQRNAATGQVLFSGGTRESSSNLGIPPRDNFLQGFNSNQRTINSTSATSSGTNAIQPILPTNKRSHSVLLNSEYQGQNQQHGSKKVTNPAFRKERQISAMGRQIPNLSNSQILPFLMQPNEHAGTNIDISSVNDAMESTENMGGASRKPSTS